MSLWFGWLVFILPLSFADTRFGQCPVACGSAAGEAIGSRGGVTQSLGKLRGCCAAALHAQNSCPVLQMLKFLPEHMRDD